MQQVDDNSSDEYDDIHLVFDIPDFNLIENLKFEKYSIIGMDTDRPMVKIDNFIFEGKFENLLSDTAICVEQYQSDDHHHHKPTVISTRTILKLNRVLIGPKKL